MKCCSCSIEKEEDDFRWANKAAGRRHSICRQCYSARERHKWATDPDRRQHNIDKGIDRRRKNSQYVWDYLKEHPCPCGENDPVVLDFDHRDPSNKHKSVANLLGKTYGLHLIKAEIAKCDVLCSNCHRRKTAQQLGYYKHIIR